MRKKSHFVGQVRWRWFLILAAALSWVVSGCGCEEPLQPVKDKAELKIDPGTWTISDQLPPNIKAYQKFVLTNKAKAGAEQLTIKSITLKDDSGQFRLLTQKQDCPLPTADPPCKPSDCMMFSNNEAICIQLPISLPINLAPGSDESISFVVEYKPSTSGVSPRAKVIINSNTKNDKNEEYVDLDINLGARGGEAVIEISGSNVKASGETEFLQSSNKTNINETKTDNFDIQNVGEADLTLKLEWEKEDKQFVITDADDKPIIGNSITLLPANQAPKNKLSLKIAYKPTTCGSHEARLKITSNAIRKKLGTTQDGQDFFSASTVYMRLLGSSPTGAKVEPGTLDFGDVKVGGSATKTFTVKVDENSSCDVIVSGLEIAPSDGSTLQPKYFAFGDMKKDGTVVPAPTDAQPVTLKKGEALTVDVTFAPQDKVVSDGVIKIKTNDPTLDPTNGGVVNLRAGVERNDPPVASFVFRCGEDNSAACKKDEDLAGSIFLSNEKKVKAILDSAKSSDRENKITKYLWEMLKQPTNSLSAISDACKEQATCSFVVDLPGTYTVQLTIWDDAGQKSSISNDLKVDP